VICVGDHRLLPARRPDRHRLRGDRDAGAGRHGRGARRLRPGHRQCRRHRRDGGHGGRGPHPHRRARRGRQHHQGGDQGLCDRLGRRSPRWCCSAPTRPTSRSSSRARRAPSGRRRRFLAVQPVRRRRPAARRAAALPVRRDGHDRGRPRGRDVVSTCASSSAPTRASWTAPAAQLRPHRRPRHQGGDQGDDHPVAAAGAGADRRLLRDRRGRRPRAGLRGARRAAARRDRLRPVRRHLDDQRRRRLGQCQEVYRGRQLRRQGLRGPQGRGDRRHGRRSLQGHGRPGREPDAAAAARGAGRSTRC
jgi:hypothetical protein